MEKHRNSIEYVIYGDYALFSEVATRTGGEKTHIRFQRIKP